MQSAPTLPAPLELLARAGSVALGPVGAAGIEPPEASAYREAKAIAAQHGAALAWMLANATPAGRYYAALLHGALGAEASRAAWQSLIAATEVISVAPGGCAITSATLGQFAQGALAGGPLGMPAPSGSGTLDGSVSGPALAPRASEDAGRPERAANAGSRAVEWFERNRGTAAAVFWLIAIAAYASWYLTRA